MTLEVALRYLAAPLFAALILTGIAHKNRPIPVEYLYAFEHADWHFVDERGTDYSAIVPASAPITTMKNGAVDNGKGTIRYRVGVDMLRRTLRPNTTWALHFPALGGTFRIKINGTPITFRSSHDYSGVGPVIPLTVSESANDDLTIDLEVDESSGTYTGAWKAAPVISDFNTIEALRDRERRYQEDLPLISALFMLVVAGLFFAIYIATGRQFAFYRLFSIGLITIVAFSLYLAGVPRAVNFYFGSATHFATRVIQSYGCMLIMESYLVWTLNETKFRGKARTAVIFGMVVLFLGALIGGLAGHPWLDAVCASIAIPMAFFPLYAWRVDQSKVFSIQYFAYVVVWVAALGGVFDSFKLLYQQFGSVIPYDHFNRYTSPMLVLLTVIVYLQHFLGLFDKNREQASQLSKQATMTTAFQMIAHDIRKPFSKMKIGLGMLERLPSNPQVTTLVSRIRVEVEKNVRSVDGILSDILESGRTAAPILGAENPRQLFEESLQEIIQHGDFGAIAFEQAYHHTTYVSVDELRFRRVFMNLIENALQAAPDGARFWVTSRDTIHADGSSMVEMTIGNSGSFIAPDRCEKIFEAFYSSGKRGGTGLGLTIAKKIVEAHGGDIRCRSSELRGTEFCFTLKAGGAIRG